MEEFVAPTPTVPADSSPTAASDITVPPPTLSQREQIRIEFYKTYDVMTGVSIPLPKNILHTSIISQSQEINNLFIKIMFTLK